MLLAKRILLLLLAAAGRLHFGGDRAAGLATLAGDPVEKSFDATPEPLRLRERLCLALLAVFGIERLSVRVLALNDALALFEQWLHGFGALILHLVGQVPTRFSD